MSVENHRENLRAELTSIQQRQPELQRQITELEDRIILDQRRAEEIQKQLAKTGEGTSTADAPNHQSNANSLVENLRTQNAASKSKEKAANNPLKARASQTYAANNRGSARSTQAKTALEKAGSHNPKRHPFKIRRVTAIDGLRGLAVLAVVLYHFFGNILRGGYLGVDVFFVLSGFLITSLLVRERATTGRIDLKDFWLRRFRRIVPAAWFVLFIGTVAAGLVGGDPAVDLPIQFLGTLMFANNWTQIAGSHSYFADSGVQIFAHYWSLAVEEQFYLLWPLLFVGLAATGLKTRKMRWLVYIGAVVSLVCMIAKYNPDLDPTRVYYRTDTHAFGLLIGAGLALWITSTSIVPNADSWPEPNTTCGASESFNREGVLRIVSLVALAGLLVLFFVLPDTAAQTYRGGLFAASIFAAIVLYSVVKGSAPVTQIFDNRVLRWLGKVSFSLYLWHWPVIVLIKELSQGSTLANSYWLGTIALVISLPISQLSFTYIETPIRRHGYLHCARILVGAAAPVWRRIAVPAVAGALAVATVVAMATGPDQTRLESDLARAAAVKQKAEKAEEAKQQELAKREIPTGDRITAIGDSVMLASADALQQEFPDIYIDAEVSRHYEAVQPIIEQMKSDGTLDPNVVLGFGTNGSASAAHSGLLDDILDALGKDRVIVLVLPYGDRDWMPEAESEVIRAARERENVYVADWCHAAKANKDNLRGDLIHPTPPGAEMYAAAIKDAFAQWKAGKHEVPGTCGM